MEKKGDIVCCYTAACCSVQQGLKLINSFNNLVICKNSSSLFDALSSLIYIYAYNIQYTYYIYTTSEESSAILYIITMSSFRLSAAHKKFNIFLSDSKPYRSRGGGSHTHRRAI